MVDIPQWQYQQIWVDSLPRWTPTVFHRWCFCNCHNTLHLCAQNQSGNQWRGEKVVLRGPLGNSLCILVTLSCEDSQGASQQPRPVCLWIIYRKRETVTFPHPARTTQGDVSLSDFSSHRSGRFKYLTSVFTTYRGIMPLCFRCNVKGSVFSGAKTNLNMGFTHSGKAA